MKIESIKIENIRGLQDHTISLNMIPNKPSLLVAPNGSGKSSLAIAFQSLTKGKIKVDKEDLYTRDERLQPKVELVAKYEDDTTRCFCANSTVNDISKEFGVVVINSRTKAEVVKGKIGNVNTAHGKLTIEPIVLMSSIPPVIKLDYSFESEYSLNLKRGVIPSISTLLSNNAFLRQFSTDKLNNIANALKKIVQQIEIIKQYDNSDKSVEAIRSELTGTILPQLRSIPKLQNIVNEISDFCDGKTELEKNLIAMQLMLLFRNYKDCFNQAKQRAEYLHQKKAYIQLFESLKKTWQNIKPKEEDGKLIVDIPHSNRLSNGERDIIVFFAMLEKAKLTLNKTNNILIIDEVFDYLDDANLVAAQYYISLFIQEMKSNNKSIFPIILTHLNPDFYKSYAFKDLKVYYLHSLPTPQKSDLMMGLLRKREELENSGNEDVISQYMLHYHSDYTKDMSDVLSQPQINAHWNEITKFKEYCFSQVENYLNNDVFCPLAVCVALREWIEKYCYDKLPNNELKESLIIAHGTQKKLILLQSQNIDYPEIFDLLGFIFNDPLHATDKKDLRQTLYSRLHNNTIRAMKK